MNDHGAELSKEIDAYQQVEIDNEASHRLLRKIDWRVLPVLCVTCALQFYDKAILSQAAIFGLRDDLKLQDGLKFSWVSLIWSFGFIAGTYPLSVLAQRFSPRTVVTTICILWSVVVLCTPACTSYTGLLVNRFILGVIEAGVSPIFMLVVGLWYTQPEQILRSGIWYSCSGGSLLITPLFNYGIGHITGGSLHPWQYMYILAGGLTLLWSISLWWIFPDHPEKAKGFSDEERELILERIRRNNSGKGGSKFQSSQLYEALLDYNLYAIAFLALASTTATGGTVTFGPIVFAGMGFDNFTSLLLNMPTGAMGIICVLSSAYLGRKLPGSRLYIVAASCFPVVLGCALLWKLPSSMRAGRISGLYLLNFFSSAYVQCIGLGTSNVAGYTKRTVYAAGTFVGYSLGSIIGPLLFDASFGPRYDNSFTAIMVFFAACFITALGLRFLLAAENTKRESVYGPPDIIHGLEDMTDKENKSFRYQL